MPVAEAVILDFFF